MRIGDVFAHPASACERIGKVPHAFRYRAPQHVAVVRRVLFDWIFELPWHYPLIPHKVKPIAIKLNTIANKEKII